MALTAAREMPARPAKSACDHCRPARSTRKGLDDGIVSFMDIFMSHKITLRNCDASRRFFFNKADKPVQYQ